MGDPKDFAFGEIAEQLGLVEPQHVDLCLLIQSQDRRAGLENRSIGQLMIERGFLTQAQVELVLSEQKKRSRKYLGPYEILDKLGQGSMGAVYRARVIATGKMIALKTLPREYAEKEAYIYRFRREAELGSKLDHPNIVRILTVGEDHGIHYMSMELVDGGDLKSILKKRELFSEHAALTIGRDIAMALDHASQHGLIHRDVKPSNILFDKRGDAKLSDFGLVKAMDPETTAFTQAGMALGTPHYIAPEQARGAKDVDIRADLYALGATIYHMLTGRPPFVDEDPMAIVKMHIKDPVQPPNLHVPGLHRDTVAMVMKLLEKDRAKRYARPTDVVVKIEYILRRLKG